MHLRIFVFILVSNHENILISNSTVDIGYHYVLSARLLRGIDRADAA
jgi:hypothetical protein